MAPLRIRLPLIASPPAAPVTQAWIKVAGTWKLATVWIKVAGTWKTATPFIRISGAWK